jgi:enamine deaminase RidA (YjgF/YER057c/UK114 family)
MVETKSVNPWSWQNKLGISQAIEVRGGQRVIYCSGITAVDANGNPMFPGDMAKQINKALDNIEVVLKQAELKLANVVRLNWYTTDITAFLNARPSYGPRLAAAGCKPSSTLLGVSSLFHPDILIEIEATAVI